jgi:hypothetical protein
MANMTMLRMDAVPRKSPHSIMQILTAS